MAQTTRQQLEHELNTAQQYRDGKREEYEAADHDPSGNEQDKVELKRQLDDAEGKVAEAEGKLGRAAGTEQNEPSFGDQLDQEAAAHGQTLRDAGVKAQEDDERVASPSDRLQDSDGESSRQRQRSLADEQQERQRDDGERER